MKYLELIEKNRELGSLLQNEKFEIHILSNIIVSADSNQLDILQSMIQYRDDPSSSWMRYAGFKSLNTFENYLSDNNINDIYQQLENILNKIGLYFYNQFLLTPIEWQDHSILFSNSILNRILSIRKC